MGNKQILQASKSVDELVPFRELSYFPIRELSLKTGVILTTYVLGSDVYGLLKPKRTGKAIRTSTIKVTSNV